MPRCIYEQFKANQFGITVVMILPSEQSDEIAVLLEKGKVGFDEIKLSLTDINVENSEATEKRDGASLQLCVCLSVTMTMCRDHREEPNSRDCRLRCGQWFSKNRHEELDQDRI